MAFRWRYNALDHREFAVPLHKQWTPQKEGPRSDSGCTQENWGQLTVYHTEPNPCTTAKLGLAKTFTAAVLDDTDGDGIPDAEEDLDLDSVVDPGETDYNNVDTDGDGIWDSVERGYQAGNPGDPTYDMDQTTVTDPLNEDSDGDNGWDGCLGLDGQEDANQNGTVDPEEGDPLFSIVDRDGDGFTVTQDCRDNPISDSPGCTSDPELPTCAANINPDAVEVCGNYIDENCDGNKNEGCGYSAVANARASTYGSKSLTGSSLFNGLVLFLLPVGMVILLRILRKRK